MAVYLDCNATTPLAPSVLQRITDSLTREWGNPSSGYEPGIAARRGIAEAREHLAAMIGGDNGDIIFTSGGTESNNMVILGIAKYYNAWLKTSTILQAGDAGKPHVITSNIEHDAIILPLRYLETNREISLSVIPVGSDGRIKPEDVMANIRPTTCLVTIMYANNETGVIMPLKEVGRQLAELNEQRCTDGLIRILFHSDVAQAVGKVSVDVDSLSLDYLSIVGHKFYGPRSGCLYARGLKDGATPLHPMLYGGGQESGYRPGTLNTPMIVGLGEAARLVGDNLHVYAADMEKSRDLLEHKLAVAFGDSIVFNCRSPGVPRLPNTTNISLLGDSLQGHLVLSRCPRLMASVGASCHQQNVPSGVLIRSGVSPKLAANAIRLSVGRHTTVDDIDVTVDQLRKAVDEMTSV